MRVGLVDAHPQIVEPPVALALEEVRLAVSVLEGGVDVVADALPHRHVPRVVQLDVVRVLVESVSGGKRENRRLY